MNLIIIIKDITQDQIDELRKIDALNLNPHTILVEESGFKHNISDLYKAIHLAQKSVNYVNERHKIIETNS